MTPRRGTAQPPIVVGGTEIAAGQRATVDIPVADLYTHANLTMSVHVVRGRRPGPVLFVSAAVHGDELNGVEIIRRLLRLRGIRQLRGTLMAIPVVNIHGFLRHSRYLPDRRDLNRSFPGSATGSVAARLAHVLTEQIVNQCDYGIDLHTGAINRPNLPQIRADLSDQQTLRLARAFGCPLMVDAGIREGSLREHAGEQGVPLLLYEAGEALRFDEFSIRAGVRGVTGVMRELGMLPARGRRRIPTEPVIALDSNWVRAPESGILRSVVELGEYVAHDQTLAYVADPFGQDEAVVRAGHAGIVIGRSNLPLAHAGDALYHVARVRAAQSVADQVEAYQSANEPGPETPPEPGEPPIV